MAHIGVTATVAARLTLASVSMHTRLLYLHRSFRPYHFFYVALSIARMKSKHLYKCVYVRVVRYYDSQSTSSITSISPRVISLGPVWEDRGDAGKWYSLSLCLFLVCMI